MLVATCPAQHREHVLGCLEAGATGILCEKAHRRRLERFAELEARGDGG